MSGGETGLGFAPLVPWAVLGAAAAAALLVLAFGALRRARGIVWRAVAVAAVLLALANPTFVVEERSYLPNYAFAVLDESPSQDVGERGRRSAAALAHVEQAVGEMEGVELRVVRAGRWDAEAGREPEDGTHLFTALERAMADVSRSRIAGAMMITDGQVHDVPEDAAAWAQGEFPLHVLLSGERGERDRRVVVEQAPSYGLVGKTLTMTIRVEDVRGDAGAAPTGEATVTIRRDGEPWRTAIAPVGTDYTLEFQLEHAGPTFFEIEAGAGPGELSLENNRAVVAVNGVRDRLRVLLISGEPHPGERTWRNLLKADPGVDLVHFTILRPPEKQDRTPVSELSLISFPVHELFELKLYEFDLIIFDRYRRRGVLLNGYLENIAQFVERGGALLVAVGPSFAGGFSLYNTPLGRVLPGRPTGEVAVDGFRPDLTPLGRRHPVTAELPGAPAEGQAPQWGRWFRQIDAGAERGSTLISGAGDRPALILDRVGEGRVAQLLSDHIWLWSRGFEGGGPQAELLRRTAHWLMKEPELEENDLKAEVRGGRLEIVRRSLEPDDSPVEVTAPSGATREVQLEEAGGGRSTASVAIGEAGVYRVSDGKDTALAAAGSLNPREVADLRTTDRLVRPITDSTGGSVSWLADGTEPEIRRVQAGRSMAGEDRLGRQGWIGLKQDQDYLVTGVSETALLPPVLALVLALGALILGWRREGE